MGVDSLQHTNPIVTASAEGMNNTAIGYAAGDNNISGSNNTFLGYMADVDSSHTNLVNATAIGANAVVTQSNSMILGGTGVNAVKVGIGTSAPAQMLSVVGTIESTAGGFKFPDGTTQTTAGITSGGSYANPAWLTSLAGSKITGNISGSASTATTVTGTVAIANGGTGITTVPAAGQYLRGTGSAWAPSTIQAGDLPFYARVAIVAANGGNYSNPATAMTNYSTWCPSPSASNPCLLKIMPGVYNVGTSPVVMQPYIDIEGSGQNTTKITGATTGSGQGTVVGASNAELRFLMVAATGASNYTQAIYNTGASPSLLNVTAIASGGGNNNYAIHSTSSSSMTMTSVIANASGGGSASNYGVYTTNNATTTMTAVTATASGGTFNYGVYTGDSATVKINNSVVNGTYTIYNSNATSTTLVSNTQLSGGSVIKAGTLTCVGAYNASYVALNMSCQ